MENANWIGISIHLQSGMVHWPDSPPVEIERLTDIEKSDTANVSKLSFGSHTGTHMDAPGVVTHTGAKIPNRYTHEQLAAVIGARP